MAICISPLHRWCLHRASIFFYEFLHGVGFSIDVHTLLLMIFLLLLFAALWLRFLCLNPLKRRIKRRAPIGIHELRKIIGLPILFVYSTWGFKICKGWVEFSAAAITCHRLRYYQWHFTRGAHVRRINAGIICFTVHGNVFGFNASKFVFPYREFDRCIRFKMCASPNLLATEE